MKAINLEATQTLQVAQHIRSDLDGVSAVPPDTFKADQRIRYINRHPLRADDMGGNNQPKSPTLSLSSE